MTDERCSIEVLGNMIAHIKQHGMTVNLSPFAAMHVARALAMFHEAAESLASIEQRPVAEVMRDLHEAAKQRLEAGR